MPFWRGKLSVQKHRNGNFHASCYHKILDVVSLWPYKLFWKCMLDHLQDMKIHTHFVSSYFKVMNIICSHMADYYDLAGEKKKLLQISQFWSCNYFYSISLNKLLRIMNYKVSKNALLKLKKYLYFGSSARLVLKSSHKELIRIMASNLDSFLTDS